MSERLAESDQRGLEPRYSVEKVSDPTGKHADCRYFVLDPQHDLGARFALRAYKVWAAKNGYDALAADLGQWLADLDRPQACPTPCDADCAVACHEVHNVAWGRAHQPHNCPSALAIPPVQAALDTTSSVTRQHYIDTGEYLRVCRGCRAPMAADETSDGRLCNDCARGEVGA